MPHRSGLSGRARSPVSAGCLPPAYQRRRDWVILSGGMDSGSITALAGRQLPWIRTFTVGFDFNSASGVEMGYRRTFRRGNMSYLFKTEHYEMVLKAGDMERVLPKLAWHLEEPRVGQCYPNFYAARLASKFVKVVLVGRRRRRIIRWISVALLPRRRERGFRRIRRKIFRVLAAAVPEGVRQHVLAPIWSEVATSIRAIFSAAFSDTRHR